MSQWGGFQGGKPASSGVLEKMAEHSHSVSGMVRCCHASLDSVAASNAFSCNFANDGQRNSMQLSNLCAMC